MSIKRGDIYIAKLDPIVGSEQGGTRPVVVIQNDVGNNNSSTVIVAPITKYINHKNYLPTHIRIKYLNNLKDSIILLEQIRTIDKKRLIRYVETLPKRIIDKLNNGIAISLGIEEILWM